MAKKRQKPIGQQKKQEPINPQPNRDWEINNDFTRSSNQPNNQQGYNNQQNYNNQQGYNNQQNYNNQQGYNQQGYNRQQGYNQQGYNRQQGYNQQGYSNNQVPRRGNRDNKGKSPVLPIAIIIVVVIIIGAIAFVIYSGDKKQQEQQQSQQQAQQQAEQQQEQQQANRNRVMEFQNFNSKTDGFIPTENLIESLKGTEVPTSDTIDETTVKSGYVSFVKGRVMISPGMMLCYIIANYNGKNYFQQVPYSTWEQLPQKGTTLVELENDQDNSGNNFISFMQVKTNLQNIVAKINQEQAQQELNNKLKKQQEQEQEEIKALNNQLSQQN